MPTFEIVCVGERFTHSVRVGGFRSGVILMKGFTVLANFVNIKMIKLQIKHDDGKEPTSIDLLPVCAIQGSTDCAYRSTFMNGCLKLLVLVQCF